MLDKAASLKDIDRAQLVERYINIRKQGVILAETLSDADQTVQSMTDASPAKWHLAHTSWFFEAFILNEMADDYTAFDPQFGFLFNSYYETFGQRQPRPARGMLTRPSSDEVLAYRAHIDAAMTGLLLEISDEQAGKLADTVILGLNHEQQHQELLLSDILHLFAQNPLKPAFRQLDDIKPGKINNKPGWVEFDGGIVTIGHDGAGFAYDNEGPSHDALLHSFALADRLVTNGEWIDFIEDDGYRRPEFWLSDGWALVLAENWRAPLYWQLRDEHYWSMTLGGLRRVEQTAPVAHISYFEADAFAHWAGARLPTEFEWEHGASDSEMKGNVMTLDTLRPLPVQKNATSGLKQIYGDLWEWTQSAYAAYPGFKPAAGAIGEYNGKFMSGQFVLRGGSCATPQGHIRKTYRNFFYPHQRWQFMGLRLAKDL